MNGALVLDVAALALWQRCPRRWWFERVAHAAPEHRAPSTADLLDAALRAGVRLILTEPAASADDLRGALLAGFEAGLRRLQDSGRSLDPDQVGRALDRVESEILDLVRRLGRSERVLQLDWSHFDTRFEWKSGTKTGARFVATVDAVGVARERVARFGISQDEPVDLALGTRVAVRFTLGERLDRTPTGLALDLDLFFLSLGAAGLFPGQPVRTFVCALRDLATGPPRDARGHLIPRFDTVLNPDYVVAFAAGQPITEAVTNEAQASRRRFHDRDRLVPKWLQQPNPDYDRRLGQPAGPAFYEVHPALRVVAPATAWAAVQITAALRAGGETDFPARGAQTGACGSCPFRRRCVAPSSSAADPAFPSPSPSTHDREVTS